MYHAADLSVWETHPSRGSDPLGHISGRYFSIYADVRAA